MYELWGSLKVSVGGARTALQNLSGQLLRYLEPKIDFGYKSYAARELHASELHVRCRDRIGSNPGT